MGKAELIVTSIQLQCYEKKLNTLSNDLANRQLSLHVSGSKGAVADELTETAEQLMAIGSALAQLAKVTETAFTNARLGFEEMDDLLAAAFRGAEG